MPSTYSPLKIQLMATGENNTTWGDVTNLNLGTAIEEAIVGSADVTFASGDVTLTLTDTNASQTARNMRLRCTGTTGGARNLIVPSIEKPYIVKNDCADSVTVKTAAGTGVAVPAGKTMWVYSDGTNVVDAVTHLSSLTLSTDLSVADGGTGASTFTANGVLYGNGASALQVTAAGTTGQVLVGNTGSAPSWATLTSTAVTSISFGTTGLTPSTATQGAVTVAGTLGVANGGTGVTTSTGTGSVVLSTSPTLTTPNLGTPSAATLTNATGLPLTTGVTGTLGVANGGTGTTTQFTSGSVVFAGASGVYTQDNANLFWDNANDRLGIGTSSPAERLDVNGTIKGGTSSGVTLLMADNSAIRNTATGGNTMYFDSGVGAGSTSGDFNFRAAASYTSRLYINGNTGNVGIGTTAPASLLHVDGGVTTIQRYGSSGALVLRSAAGTQASPTAIAASTVLGITVARGYDGAAYRDVGNIAFISDGAISPTSSPGFIQFNTTPSGSVTGLERMRIDSTGNVGIGTSAPSSYGKLTVNGNIVFGAPGGRNAAFTNNIGIWTTGDPADDTRANIGFTTVAGASSSSSYITFATNNYGVSGGERMRIDSSGNVGIGTSAPAAGLDVRSAAVLFGSTSADATAKAGRIVTPHYLNAEEPLGSMVSVTTVSENFVVIGGGSASFNAATSIRFNTAADTTTLSGTERMRIDSSGNVGIGTSTINARLSLGNLVSNKVFALYDDGANQYGMGIAGSQYRLFAATGANICFGNYARGTDTFTETVRIDSSGNLLVNTTDVDANIGGASGTGMQFSVRVGFGLRSSINTDVHYWNKYPTGDLHQFRCAGTVVGSISITGSATAYNTSSDQRLKENIAPADDAAALIDAIQVRKFDWKADGSHQRYGMVAQELLEVAPEAVSVPADEDEMMGVDYSKLVPMLIKEIQSLRARVAQLEGN